MPAARIVSIALAASLAGVGSVAAQNLIDTARAHPIPATAAPAHALPAADDPASDFQLDGLPDEDIEEFRVPAPPAPAGGSAAQTATGATGEAVASPARLMSFDRPPYAPYQGMAPGGAHPLDLHEVAESLGARGFVNVTGLRLRGRIYVCEATGPRGERVQLVVDADSGEISGMQLLGYDGDR